MSFIDPYQHIVVSSYMSSSYSFSCVVLYHVFFYKLF